jgi:hypothetical protein
VQPWSNTFVSVGHVWINYSSFWRTSHFTGHIYPQGNWKKVRERELGHSLVQMNEGNKSILEGVCNRGVTQFRMWHI